MHLPQIRSVWRGGDARLHMHIAAECRQRKDLRLPVVLVHDPRRLVGGRDRLQVLIIYIYVLVGVLTEIVIFYVTYLTILHVKNIY